MLGRLDHVIEKRRAAMVDMQMQAESLEKEIADRRRRLKQDKTILRKVAGMLEGNQDCKNSYVISGIRYSYRELDQDAVLKSRLFRQEKELLLARQETLAQFEEAINTARQVLSDAEIERARLADAVQNLGIRAESLKTATNLETGKQYASNQSLGKGYNDIHQAISDLGRRLEKGERLFDMKKVGTTGIDYAKNVRQQSGLDALREVLK